MSEEKAGDLHWKTAISRIQPNEVRLRGYRIDELMGRITFSQGIYLALTGNLPSAEVGALIDALLLSSVDHGATPPSILAALTAASTGAPINAAIAAGVLAINKHHGGAIEDCMKTLLDGLKRMKGENLDAGAAGAKIVAEAREKKLRLAGFGHRIHTADPRTPRLFELAAQAGVAAEPIALIQAMEAEFEKQTGKALPINVDGAMAAVLLGLGFDARLANAFFIMARVPGMVAHIQEEWTREKPMRRIHPSDHEYDGPPDRSLG